MSETNLQAALKQLSREAQPTHDLWPGIAERIGADAPGRAKPPRRQRLPYWAQAAAMGLLAIGGLRWWLQVAVDPHEQMVQQQVAAMAREYDAALAQVPQVPVPPVLTVELQTLDASAAQIRQALRQAPQSTWLIEQLRRTYALRLQLRQRALHG